MFKCEKTCKIINCINALWEKKVRFIEKYITPILLLTLRIMIAMIFLKSGLTKIDNFQATIFLFEYEYKVPFLSPTFAAYSATFFELSCSILLIAGLFTRLAALPLFIMTLVIQFTIIENDMHFYWLAILATIMTFGGGFLSCDRILKRCFRNCQ